MGRVKGLLAALCHACPLCVQARRRPDSLVGRILSHPLHADHCPFWKAERALYGSPADGAQATTGKG